ncbi:MAG TPA: hypothetical protein VFG69_02730 [Nannocystaceae bacterium]|nr:hypothetical protein [Nannocystaceae bacterium]
MPVRPSPRLLVPTLLGLAACSAVVERIEAIVARVGVAEDAQLEGEIDRPEAPSVATSPVVDEPALAAIAPAAATTPPAPPAPDELELHDVEVEWVDRSSWGYYGAADKSQNLRVIATAKLRAAIGSDANLTVKAICRADPAPVADANFMPIPRSPADPRTTAPEGFPVRLELFQLVQPGTPDLCRVQFILIDNGASPPRRGQLDLCWHRGSKTPIPCTKTDELAPGGEVRDAWAIERAEFTASGELLFSVIAGRERAPDRLALRTTCYVGDKRYVDFDYIDARWYALAPGEGMRQRTYMTDLADMLRTAECDLAFQHASYDFAKYALRGTKDLQHLCVRPSGLSRGACRVEATESTAWDPKIAPAEVEYTHSGAHAYRGWLNAYMNGELTVHGTLPPGTTVDVVARCGKREAKQSVTGPIPFELLWPGQTVRVYASAAMSARSARGCELDTVLSSTDGDGKPATFSLARTCFDKAGSGHPCAP